MADQITHMEIAQQVNGRGKVVYQVACGKLLLGHAGVRKNLDKVTCIRCRRAVIGNAVVKAATPVVVNGLPTTRDEWYRYIKMNGMQKLGEGASRKVYALDATRVIKIEKTAAEKVRNDLGNQCNKEVAYWNRASAEKRSVIATILAHGDSWIIMERAKTTVKEMFANEWDNPICQTLTSETGIRDLHPANIGYFGKGQFKVIDYAL